MFNLPAGPKQQMRMGGGGLRATVRKPALGEELVHARVFLSSESSGIEQ